VAFSECAPQLEHDWVARFDLAATLSAALCEAQEECCPAAPVTEVCRRWTDDWFEWVDRDATELGLSYDGYCASYQLSLLDALGCDVTPAPELTNFGTCSIYFGSGEEGSPCATAGTLGSTCEQGLACSEGTCRAPCTLEPGRRVFAYGYACSSKEVPGEISCMLASEPGDFCGYCVEGSYCGDSGFCEPALPIGEGPCSEHSGCIDGVCIEQHCAAGQPEGAPCNDGCGAQLSCDTASNTCVRDPYICQGAS